MTRKIFRELISVEEARQKLLAHFQPQPLGIETITLENVYGRVLGENIEAGIDVPSFDRATMDGFAVRAEDTYGADEDSPVELKVAGKVNAGEKPEVRLSEGEAIEVATGTPIPVGANATLMVEYTVQTGSTIKAYKAVSPGENIMASGADIMAGELIMRKNTLLTPREIGVLAAVGMKEVACFRKPKVAVLSTGNEIVKLGESLSYGKLYDINGYTLYSSILECGCQPFLLGVVRDDRVQMLERLKDALRIGDVIVTSGSTSAGAGDLMYQLLDELGKPGVLFHGVSVKPGKPVTLAVVGKKPIFGLPGYPTSALMIFDIFTRPVLREMAGLSPEVERSVLDVRVHGKIYATPGRRDFLPVNVIRADSGEYTAYPMPTGSDAITTLAEADGYIEIPESRAFLEEGDQIQIKLFSSKLRPADLMFIGSHCMGVDILVELLHKRHPGFKVKVINVGSAGGLAAIRRGEGDMAGIHLLDDATGDYNIPFLERYGVADKVQLVRGYRRRQGLIVAGGNPMGIKNLSDVLRRDITLINRNAGSGTRVLLDLHLRRLAEQHGVTFKELVSGISGYGVESKSHSAVAAAVAHGRVNVGLGIETAACRYGLDFIPVAEEQYDFAFRVERLTKPCVQAFQEVLKSDDFKVSLGKKAEGLTASAETGDVVYSPKR